jgi:prepilin-type processing-associated H-X9-DG protein/prepilin-type N-terminal cleavage/methylation domain-containing protein
MQRRRSGFSLIELMVVIAIIVLLMGLLLPAVQSAREAARRSQCLNNLRQIGIGLTNYHEAFGVFPMGYAARSPFVDGVTDTADGWGWAAMVLPHLEQTMLYNSINFSRPIDDVQNTVPIRAVFQIYVCPCDGTRDDFGLTNAAGNVIAMIGPSSYAACVGGDETDVVTGINHDGQGRGIMFRNSRVRAADITDGLSDTILVGERAWSIAQGAWPGALSGGVLRRGPANQCPKTGALFGQAPALVQAHCHLLNTDTDPDGGLDDFSSRHPGGANMLFADGSVRFVKSVLRDNGKGPDGTTNYSPASLILQALGTRNGDEMVSGDSF